VGRDARLEDARHLLRHGGDLVPPASPGGHRDLRGDVDAPAIALEPHHGRQQRGAGLHRERRRAAHHPRLLPEELHLDPAAGDVPVGGQADHPAGAQPLRQDPEPAVAAGRRQHLKAE
jgi:hypothetical protein